MTLHVGGNPTIKLTQASEVQWRVKVQEVPYPVYKPYVPRWLAYALAGETAAVLTLLAFGSPL